VPYDVSVLKPTIQDGKFNYALRPLKAFELPTTIRFMIVVKKAVAFRVVVVVVVLHFSK
jgi:hypothetical protein